MKRLLPALVFTAVMIASAPFMGVIRDVLFERFAGTAVRSLLLGFVALAVIVFLVAVIRIREQRAWRYAGLVLTAVLLLLEGAVFGDGPGEAIFAAQVNIAEKMHLVTYGLLALLLYRAFRPAANPTIVLIPFLLVTCAGVLEEAMQHFVETRLGDIKDVWLNSYSGVCGLVFSLSLFPPQSFSWRVEARDWQRIGDLVALAVLLIGIFYNAAHLGYEHDDPELGRFRSWFTMEELRAAEIDRAQRWQEDPPTSLSPWRREDFYLTEAAWHANHRNERYRAGDAYMALQANRILEKYYDPFLDLESFRGSGKHRYPPEVRRELEAQAPHHDARAYLSPVLTHRVFPEPTKRQFFAMLLPAVLAIWLLPRLLIRRKPA